MQELKADVRLLRRAVAELRLLLVAVLIVTGLILGADIASIVLLRGH